MLRIALHADSLGIFSQSTTGPHSSILSGVSEGGIENRGSASYDSVPVIVCVKRTTNWCATFVLSIFQGEANLNCTVQTLRSECPERFGQLRVRIRCPYLPLGHQEQIRPYRSCVLESVNWCELLLYLLKGCLVYSSAGSILTAQPVDADSIMARVTCTTLSPSSPEAWNSSPPCTARLNASV